MINQVEIKRPRPGFRLDPKRGVYVGWRIDVRIGGRRYRNTFASRPEAERFLAELRVEKQYRRAGLPFTSGRTPRISEIFAQRLKVIAGRNDEPYARTVFARFASTIAFDPLITDLRRAHIQKYINGRFEDGVKASTIGREITLLSAAIRSAPEMFPDELENYEPPRIPRPRVPTQKGKTRVITETEKEALIAAIAGGRTRNEKRERRTSRPVIAAMFELAWLLGLRLGEVLKLTPADFDEKAGSLRVVRWKTRAITRFDYLPARAIGILSEFTSHANTTIFTLNCSLTTMYAVLRAACAECGLEYGRASIDGVTFHATRHSFTTRLIEVTDLATAQSYTGHANKQMIAYYSHASDDSRRTAMQRMYGSDQHEKLLGILKEVEAGATDPETAAAAIGQLFK